VKKSIKKSDSKREVTISFLLEDWLKNSEMFKNIPNFNFNEYLIYCTDKYTILPK